MLLENIHYILALGIPGHFSRITASCGAKGLGILCQALKIPSTFFSGTSQIYTRSSSTWVKSKFPFRYLLLTTVLMLHGPFDMCLFEKVSQWTGAFLIFDKFYLTWGNQRGPHSTSSDGETLSNSRDVTWMITHSPFNNKMQIKADGQLILF